MARKAIWIFLAVISVMVALSGAAALAGPMDNALEFQQKAASEAERDGNAPQSDAASISWGNDGSGAGTAVNTGGADSSGAIGTDGSGAAGGPVGQSRAANRDPLVSDTAAGNYDNQ
jgi:hypothetical protein